MSRTYRFIALMLVLVFGAALSMSAVSAQDEPVTINWWHISTADAQAAYWQSLADQYMADHPNVTIDITILANEDFKARLVTVMQAGDPPDLFQSWGGGVLWQYADAGLVRDISSELEGDWMDSFAVPAAVELYGQNGEYYGVPYDWGAVGMFYNKALFEQAGITEVPTTWAEFLTDVQMLKVAGITPIALGEKEKWPGHFWWVSLAIREGGQQAFLDAYDRTGSFADEPFVRAGEDLKQLIDMDPFPEGFLGLTHDDEEAMFGNGQAAIQLMGQWAESAQQTGSTSGEGIGDDLGWFNFPMVEGGAGNPGDTLGGGDGFAVGANAPDATIDFLRFLTSEESQRGGVSAGFTPPVVNGVEDTYSDDSVITSIVNARNGAPYFQLYYDQFLPPALAGIVVDSVEALFAGVYSPEEVAQAIEDSASMELSGS